MISNTRSIGSAILTLLQDTVQSSMEMAEKHLNVQLKAHEVAKELKHNIEIKEQIEESAAIAETQAADESVSENKVDVYA